MRSSQTDQPSTLVRAAGIGLPVALGVLALGPLLAATSLAGAPTPPVADHVEPAASSAMSSAMSSAVAMRSDGSTGFETIEEDDIEADIALLTNPYLEGRDSPSFGLEFAAEWVAGRFEELGLESPEDIEDHLTFYTRRMPAPDPEETSLKTPLARDVRLGADFTALLGAEGQAAGPAVFCGYGIGVKGFDELKDLELDGAIAVLVEGEPRHKRVLDGPTLTQAANVYRKLVKLAELGVRGALVVRRAHPSDVPVPPQWPERQPMGFRHTWAMWADGTVPFYGPSPIPALEVSWTFAEELLEADLDAHMDAIDKRGKPKAFEGARPQVSLACGIEQRNLSLPNVIGIVRGSDPELAGEYVVIGAHLDHIGADPLGRIGVGADDNASGTSAMLAVMKALAADPPPRSVIGMAFTSEEDGLLGSDALARTPPVSRSSIVAMVNLDMIGRGPTKGVVALGVRENPGFEGVIDDARRRFKTGIKDVEMQEGQELFRRSDHFSFHQVGIPALFFFEHVPISDNPDYHTWRDLPELVDVAKIANTAKLAYGVVRELTERPERLPAPKR
ncbi:Bacterial leucyl aminopeptidase precursor [Planctomycetes bacterium Pla163]|uniref:Bacterial leucyl aminopeptidase n=1 Tax=Rohdeia mirabilis TaxID=2528008 RepID=A0A518D0G1_9BACT|nr:Bacterial leucyl aminopeptidase precursor [Planctomycetes bacterium Pla163]